MTLLAYEKKRTLPLISERRIANTKMPRFKRNPILYVVVAFLSLYLLYHVTAGSAYDMPLRTSTESRLNKAPDRSTDSSTFRQITPEEIAHSTEGQGANAVHPDVEKEQLMKDLAGDKPPATVSSIAHPKEEAVTEVEEQSVAGRKMMPKPKEKPKYPVTNDDKSKFIIGEEPARNGGKPEKVTDPATLEAKAELDDILKRSPSKPVPTLFTPQPLTHLSSNHLLEITLPVFCTRQTPPPANLHH